MSTGEHIPLLIAEANPGILVTAGKELALAGYKIVSVPGGAEAVDAANNGAAFVLMDLLLSDMDGVDVIRQLRADSAVPIIVCSGRTGRDDRLRALYAGADDFLAKPFRAAELLARMRAVRRRAQLHRRRTRVLALGTNVVNLATREVRGRDGQPVQLTATQWAVLEILARRVGSTLRHAQILEQVWGPGYQSETQYLRQYVAQLRRKLEIDPQRPRHLVTEPGIGYRLML